MALILIGIFLILTILFASSRKPRPDVLTPGRELAKRFEKLGDMKWKTANEIIAVVGKPSTISNGSDYRLYQWQATGYHIAIKFGLNDVFWAITHEHAGF
jgi:hypothetical protein